MDKKVFSERFGSVFEHSPWVADAVFETDVESILTDVDKLSERFKAVFMGSAPELQLATFRAHPQLVCALAEVDELSETSASEQSAAGLDRCSDVEFAEFGRLNEAYSEKFGYPFIIAVRGRERHKILNLFRMRLKNDAVLEYQTALLQACWIARYRIEDILDA